MSWIHRLYETYENCRAMIGKIEDDSKVPLLPICHTTQKAQIEIIIDEKGNFQRARLVPREQARTIIPCTEASGGRTRGEAPHPLCDKLQYIAADFKKFTGEDSYYFAMIAEDDFKTFGKKDELKYLIEGLHKSGYIDNAGIIQSSFNVLNNVHELHIDKSWEKKKDKIYGKLLEKNNKAYSNLLSDWCKPEHAHRKATAVFKYVQKGGVIKDLIDHKILHVDADGILLKKRAEKKDGEVKDIFDLLPGRENKKNGKFENWQADAFIRWEVEIPNDVCSKAWEDKTLRDSWIKFYSGTKQNKILCYVTGEKQFPADQHPAKLRNDGDKAKLISSNDLSGFTFRGRFTEAEQVCAIGFEVTQKSHSALRWLISRQGNVFFEGKGINKKPKLTIVAWSTVGKQIPKPMDDSFDMLGVCELVSDEKEVAATAQYLALKLKKKIAGYKADLGTTDSIVVMGLDSATPGRMAITYYRELTGSDFLDRLDHWHESCAWIHDYHFVEEKYIRFVGAPAPKDIAEAAYGSKSDDKLKKTTVERLLPCIIEGRPLPRDIVESAVRTACKRLAMDEWKWNKTLSIACALYKKYCEKEDYIMSLEHERKTRDYLYGRLLAAADCMEKFALFISEKKRDTNSARLMQRFSDRPCSTWKIIELSLASYKARLGGRAKKYTDVIDAVMNKFDPPEDFISDKPLSGEFLLGYHCQRENLKPKKDEPESVEDAVVVE
ncbi:MAG: type I-C CRISPR-associated protein Cas8c/Csd1 [Elusimicrobiota bacterium]